MHEKREAERIKREAERIKREEEQAAERFKLEAEREAKREAAQAAWDLEKQEMARQREKGRQETEQAVKEMSRKVGDLTSRWGQFVEGIVAPACLRVFAERGIMVQEVYPRVKAKPRNGRNMEVDLIAADGDVAVVVEVKSNLKVEDVRDHLQKLAEFREFYPRFAVSRILGAVAGIVSEEGAETFARKQGLFVFVQSGETVRLSNDEGFVPRAW
jgi:hypothetical protein